MNNIETFNLISYLEQGNAFLEKSYLFRGFKFILAFYLILMAVAMILMLYRLVKYDYWKVLMSGSELPNVKGRMQLTWEKSVERLESSNPNKWKAAILELSSMLNEILGIVGYEGVLLGERLEHIQTHQLENIAEVIEANKVKNLIVQDDEFVLTKEEAKRVAEVFGRALRLLEAIE
ncbi:hypothetical protein HN784_00720 [bacterium]|mgnify:FL=1|jgi:hypothetical protein|nr:hypothetical protein [bacterium]MBT4251599.1 hypothetical protein [bacterium]MBT4597648.1 hypothetical protein [bacterium]MBT6753661.1 hypothetical protein [bacterium]MBT7037798.1 hypothetical protein [bacterium]